ncbi:heavy metal-associated isoprenylated plant protein 39-like [Wolffia australiana]
MAEKKVIVRVDVADDKDKRKAMKAVASLIGISFMSMDLKEKKMTVIGLVDPVKVVEKLRKHWHAQIVNVGPKEEPKKEEPKKPEPKKEEPKKEAPKKEQPKEEPKKEEHKKDTNEQIAELVKLYKAQNPYMTTTYAVYSREEDPNACVIS